LVTTSWPPYAAPFEWKFTRQDLDRVAHRLELPAAQAA